MSREILKERKSRERPASRKEKRMKTELRNWFCRSALLDSLPEPLRKQCWDELAARARDVTLLAAPSRYFASLMAGRLSLDPKSIAIAPNGINLEGFDLDSPQGSPAQEQPPVLGYFARMCKDKGLDVLVEAYIELRKRGRAQNVKLKIGGGCGPTDQPLVDWLREQLGRNGLLNDVEFHPNLDRAGKIAFLRSLSVFSVPARTPEAFGLYVIESMAAGVPVVQPRLGAFPELVETTGGGVLYDPQKPAALTDALDQILLAAERRTALSAAGKSAVKERFSAQAMAEKMVKLFEQAGADRGSVAAS
jgi:glycosyltransferase involved in cell wall biosynthesis